MARWFIDAAREDSGSAPERVALLREEGGNRTELTELAQHFEREGVSTVEVDPREVEMNGSGFPEIGGHQVSHGYLKLGIRKYSELRPQMDGFARGVREGKFFVQNGQSGRWIGDNKHNSFALLYTSGTVIL